MLSIIFESMLINFPSRVLNIFLSPNGYGNILSQTDGVLTSNEPNAQFGLFSLSIFFIHLTLCTMTRYYLGYVADRVLILEIAHADTVQKDEHGEVKQSPIYRNIKEAVPVIYHSQNWQNIFQALLLSLLYYFAHYWITAFLERFIFRHTVLRPFAYAASSVLLCDIHFLKTGTAISARCPLSPLMTTEDPDRFSQLAGPAFALGMSKALMNRVESVIKYLILSRKGESPNSMGMRAGTDVLIVMVVIVFRVAGILPGTIIMTLTEVSLLPPGLETIIPSRTKCRGVLISEVLGGSKITPGFAGFVDIMKPFRVPQLTLLIGLHLQKCHLQVMIELISSFLILAMIL